MRMRHFIAAFFLAVIGFFGFQKINAAATLDTSNLSSPIVIELFTSQSCSSCPPADRALSDVAQNPNVIALGFHVTYWNHLHWKDTLSRQFSTDRQRSYASSMRSRRVYTPQMVVNGRDEFVGSNRLALGAAIQSSAPLKAVGVQESGDGMIKITLPQAPAENYTLWLFGVKSGHHEDVPSGENRGKSLNYTNPVLRELNLGSWEGNAKSMTLPLPKHDEIDHYVVLAQKTVGGNAGTGEIIAAGKSF